MLGRHGEEEETNGRRRRRQWAEHQQQSGMTTLCPVILGVLRFVEHVANVNVQGKVQHRQVRWELVNEVCAE